MHMIMSDQEVRERVIMTPASGGGKACEGATRQKGSRICSVFYSFIFFATSYSCLVVLSHAIGATSAANWWGVNWRLRSLTIAEIVEAQVAQKRLGFAPVRMSQPFLSR